MACHLSGDGSLFLTVGTEFFVEKYHDYRELMKKEEEGKTYKIQLRHGKSDTLVIAPHGGGIEPGTTEIADAVAGNEHGFYSFEGIKIRQNLDLHITSRHFNEPLGINMAENSRTILAIHGCRGEEPIVYIGGRDTILKEKIKGSLKAAGFEVQVHPRFPGLNPSNVCNRSRTLKGVQLEITEGLRRLILKDLSRTKRKTTTHLFDDFVTALRTALTAPGSRQKDFSSDRAGERINT